ncbi:hypothetical protein JCM19045_846 [Bacillus sp. JCM 19045]|nr:hypothetical protein JCM19045_846 [Bacillus sp. JCM 19045]
MSKKLLKFFILLMIVLAPLSSANAASTDEQEKTAKEVEELKEQYGFETIDIDDITHDEIVEFESVEELENFIKYLQEPKEFEEVIDTSAQNDDFGIMANGSHVINWWAPFSGWGMTGLACWRNIAFSYEYKHVSGKLNSLR